MGCGTSKAVASAGRPTHQRPVDRDLDDAELDPIHVIPTLIPQFDELFKQVAQELNVVVGYNNTVNDCIADIKETASTIVGAWRVELSEAPSVDLLLLQLVLTPSGDPLGQEKANAMKSRPTTRHWDQQLAEARLRLQEALVDQPNARLSISSEGRVSCSQPDLKEVATFEHALEQYNACLKKEGCNCKATLKPSLSPGSQSLHYALVKPAKRSEVSEEILFEPVTPLDVAACSTATAITTQEDEVVETLHRLALAVKQLDPQPSLQVTQRRVWPLTSEMTDNVSKRQATVEASRAIAAANAALYKLCKLCYNVHAELSVGQAMVEVITLLYCAVEKSRPGVEPKELVKLDPFFAFNPDGSFDFDLEVDLDPSLDLPPFPDCLPDKAKFCWATIEETCSIVSELASNVKVLRPQLELHLQEAQATAQQAPEAAPRLGLGLKASIQAARNTATNISAVVLGAAALASFYGILRWLGEQVQAGVEEMMGQGKSVAVPLELATQVSPLDILAPRAAARRAGHSFLSSSPSKRSINSQDPSSGGAALSPTDAATATVFVSADTGGRQLEKVREEGAVQPGGGNAAAAPSEIKPSQKL